MLTLIIVMCLLAIGITIIVSYSVGYNTALGKPKMEEHMQPGTRYAHVYDFTEVAADGTLRRVALLHNLENGLAEFCTPQGPIPAAQLVAVKGNDGKIRLEPAPELRVDVIA